MTLAKVFYLFFIGPRKAMPNLKWGRDIAIADKFTFFRKFISYTDIIGLEERYEQALREIQEQRIYGVFMSINYMTKCPKRVGGIPVAVDGIYYDLDTEEPAALDKVREKLRDLIDRLTTVCKCPYVHFSGRKGFAVRVWLPEPKSLNLYTGEQKKRIYKALAFHLLSLLDIKNIEEYYLDTAVFDVARVTRLPYTPHEKSKKIVTPLDTDLTPIELESFDLSILTNAVLYDNVARELLEYVEEVETFRTLVEKARLLRSLMRIMKKKRIGYHELHPIVKWLLEHGVPEGYRNNSAFVIATHLKAKGMSREEVLMKLKEWNLKNQPPLPEKELEYVVNSVFSHDYKPVTKSLKDFLKDLYVYISVS